MKTRLFSVMAIAAMVFAACSGGNEPVMNDGALRGEFSVDANGTIVHFSQGNLQYRATKNVWRFAINQWDFVGDAEAGNVVEGAWKCNNNKIAENYDGWIDLFGWGTGVNPTRKDDDNSKYQNFIEWGSNAISNAGNQPNQWRTLRRDEWDYILSVRNKATELRSLATVNGVHGLILLPDRWGKPAGVEFAPNSFDWNTNTYEGDKWSLMEAAGAVFLPASGYRTAAEGINDLNSAGFCWSATSKDENESHLLNFSEKSIGLSFGNKYAGNPVRLVQ